MTVANNLTTKIQSTETDNLGRWAKIRFFAKGGLLTAYSLYRPNPGSLSSSGANTVWMQHYRQQSKTNKTVNPRKQFIDGLIVDIHKEQAMQAKVLLSGNFNEDPRDEEENGLLHLMTECSLSNVFEVFKNHLPSTRDNNRSIDHFLVSSDLMKHVTKAGYLPDESSFTSDHSGLFIDLSPQIVDTKNAPISQPKNRKLKMSNPIKVAKYVDLVLTQFQHHNIEKRVEHIIDHLKTKPFTPEIGEKLNKIDKHISEMMLQAESQISPDSTPYAYSGELDTQMRTVRLIKKFIDKQSQKYAVETYANTEMEEKAAKLSRLPLEDLPDLLI